MTRIRPSSIRLALVAAGLLFTQAFVPVQADPLVATGSDLLSAGGGMCEVAPASMRPSLGACERALAACMNGGGNSDTCWNAYWRCIS